MNKYIIITALILSVVSLPAFAEDPIESLKNLEAIQEKFYESPTVQVPVVEVVEGSTIQPIKGMPLFKKTRIKITNYLRERDYKKTQEFLKKHAIEDEDEITEETKTPEVSEENSDTLELEGGVREQVTPSDVTLDADNIDYDDKTMDIIATGSPVLSFPPQGIVIKSDKFIYNSASNILKAFGKVEIIKDGKSVYGEDLQINMNEETALLNNVETKPSFMTVTARKSEMDENTITLYNGKIVSKDSYVLNLQTRMVGGLDFTQMFIDENDKSSLYNSIGDTTVNVKAEEIIVDAKKNHDVVTLKKAKINFGDCTLLRFRSFSAHTNKRHDFFEANYPEIASRGILGLYAGPGFVVDTPLQGGSTLKLIPMLNIKSGIGIGGLMKYNSGTNYTEFGYGSSKDVFILRGKQNLDDKLFLQYGMNSYMDEWFLGRRLAKYDAELVYHDDGIVPSTLAQNLNLNFRHRFGIGYMHDSDYNRHGESLATSDIGTMRTRYMAEINQELLKYEDKEKLKAATLSLVLQGSAALYGTGDTQFIGRVGPLLHTQYKYWMQDLGYYASAIQDNTPLTVYDTYRYGHGSVYIREALRLNKYITVGWSGTINVTNDAPNGKPFQENSFIFSLGPDDFKFNIGYDWVRQQTFFSFIISMDTAGSSVEYDKMVIKNPDRLAKSNEEDVELKVFDSENVQAKPKKMMYAEVIDIEDPDKEHI